ncbi:MAG TPA: flagellar hook-basal body complex protein [Burkholderiales bacterium]|nr:flagellar hook-basal body complex protein [Burkholderiales bacterium]
MLSTIYTALSGMLGFSKGLDVISNNIANLNTPGYKGSELAFRDLFYRYSVEGGAPDGSRSQVGSGLDTKSTRTSFKEGELRDTGNPLDVAIDGNGFLILQRDAQQQSLYGSTGLTGTEQVYTRAGQLEFGQDGVLVERVSGGHVMVFQNGNMQEMSIDGLRTNPPQATTEIHITGNLSAGSTTADLTNVTVIDQAGHSHTLSFHFTVDPADSTHWHIDGTDENNQKVLTGGEVRFQANGSPAPGANTVSFDFAPGSLPATTITLNIGDPGSFSGVTNFSSASSQAQLQVQSQNGVAAGSLTKATFDESGALQLTYSNGRTVAGPSLALAWFDDLQALRLTADSIFVNDTGQTPTIGTASQGVMGRVVAGRVELSNVELTAQFTDLIILQRGYQASSQVVSVANEMIQQLIDIGQKR